MRILNKTIIVALLIGLFGASQIFAYSSDWRSLSAGAGKGSSESYEMINDVVGSGIVVGDTAQNEDTFIGFLAGLFSFGGDVDNPVIANFKIDGKSVGEQVRDGDYINNDAVITATVTDADSDINQTSSVVGGDDNTVAFNSDPDIYNAATGALNYTFSGTLLTDGDHTVKIAAVDTTGNATESAISVKVDSTLRAIDPFAFPNPYDGRGNLKIAYRLTRDTTDAVTIWVFDSFNQLVYKRLVNVGGEGSLAGYNELEWNTVNNYGELLKNGIYFIRITEGNKKLARIKLAVLR
jgi:hypothetical protein